MVVIDAESWNQQTELKFQINLLHLLQIDGLGKGMNPVLPFTPLCLNQLEWSFKSTEEKVNFELKTAEKVLMQQPK